MKDQTFRGVYPALTTPFRPDLSLDAEGLTQLTDAVIRDGVHGIVVNGCTGESWSLSADERKIVFETTVKAAGNRVRVWPGQADKPPRKRWPRSGKPQMPAATA